MNISNVKVLLVLVGLMPLCFSCVTPGNIPEPKPITRTNSIPTVVYGFDGTGQNLKHGEKTNVYQFIKAHRTSTPNVSNIYAAGVGSAKPSKFNVINLPGNMGGAGGRAIVESMYKQLVANFKKGHKGIVIVGFSRGAALSREFAHLINDRGDPLLYRKEKLPKGDPPTIQFMGLFDTVYSFGWGPGKKDIGYRKSIPSNVRAVAHATAEYEKRNLWDLWSIHTKSSYLNTTRGSIEAGDYRAEAEFEAGHDDVGGARDYKYYSYAPLKWVIDEGIKAQVNLVLPDKALFPEDPSLQEQREGWGKRQIYFPQYEPKRLPDKVTADTVGKAKSGCKGKQIYLSGSSCYSCPNGYRRFSPLRKMTHAKACTQRGAGRETTKASYKWEANGCARGQFKHKGSCKTCPSGTKRKQLAGLDSGYCKVL